MVKYWIKKIEKIIIGRKMKVYCEDGWIVFLRRTHDTNFYQDWQGYAKGFGEIDDGLINSKILLK